MKVVSHIDDSKKFRTHKVEGVLKFDEIEKELKNIYEAPDFDSDMNALWDLTDAVIPAIDVEGVKSIVEIVRKNWGLGGKSKAAIVVSGDLEFGLSRMGELLFDKVSKSEIHVFKKINKAKKWLED